MGLQSMSLDEIMYDIRLAAEEVAADWPALFTAEELEADISLQLLEKETALDVAFMHPDHRNKYLSTMARDAAQRMLVELAHHSNRHVYSVSSVRGHLESGKLTEPRPFFSAVANDLDLGCKYLSYALPRYAMILADRYLRGDINVEPGQLSQAVQALTNCCNNLHRMPRKVIK